MREGKASHERWTPTTFVLRGQHCPLDEIQIYLDELQEKLGAELLVCLTFSGKVLRSLCFAAGSAVVAGDLARGFATHTTSDPYWGIDQYSDPGPAGVVEILHSLGGAFVPLAEALSSQPASKRDIAWRASDSSPRFRLCILSLGGRSGDLTDRRISVDRLVTRVLSSLPAAVHREQYLNQNIEAIDNIDPAGFVSPSASTAASTELLDLLFRITSADGVAWYRMSNSRQRLRIERFRARSEMGEPIKTIALGETALPPALAATGRRLVVSTADLPDPQHSRQRSPERLATVWPGDPVVDEVCIPIADQPFGQLASVLGVLVLTKVRTASTKSSLSNYDISLARNVAVRIAFQEVFTNHQQIVARHRDRIDRIRVESLALGAASTQRGHEVDVEAAEQTDRDISLAPVSGDFALARSECQQICEEAMFAMRAHSATVRTVEQAPAHLRSRYGALSLRLLAGAAGDSSTPSARDILVDEDSVVGWVALSGRVCHIPNWDTVHLRQHPGLRGIMRHRESSKSSLTVPLVVDQRTVGTMNFESPMADAFSDKREMALFFASEISTSLGSVRQGIVDSVLSIASSLHRSAHELNQDIDEVEDFGRALVGSDPTMGEEALRLVSQMRARLDPSQHDQDLTLSPPTIQAVIDSCIETTGFDYVHLHGWADPLVFDVEFVPDVHDIYMEVISSLQRFSLRSQSEPVVLRPFRSQLGGDPTYDCVMRYTSNVGVDDELLQALFRVPIRENDAWTWSRPHLGSFTAGHIARGLGGMISIRRRSGQRMELLVSLRQACISLDDQPTSGGEQK